MSDGKFNSTGGRAADPTNSSPVAASTLSQPGVGNATPSATQAQIYHQVPPAYFYYGAGMVPGNFPQYTTTAPAIYPVNNVSLRVEWKFFFTSNQGPF